MNKFVKFGGATLLLTIVVFLFIYLQTADEANKIRESIGENLDAVINDYPFAEIEAEKIWVEVRELGHWDLIASSKFKYKNLLIQNKNKTLEIILTRLKIRASKKLYWNVTSEEPENASFHQQLRNTFLEDANELVKNATSYFKGCAVLIDIPVCLKSESVYAALNQVRDTLVWDHSFKPGWDIKIEGSEAAPRISLVKAIPHRVSVCNFAPYTVQTGLALGNNIEDQHSLIVGNIHDAYFYPRFKDGIKPGTCEELHTYVMADNTTFFLTVMRLSGLDGQAHSQIQKLDRFEEFWPPGTYTWNTGVEVFGSCVDDLSGGPFKADYRCFSEINGSYSNNTPIVFSKINFDSERNFIMYVYDPVACGLPRDNKYCQKLTVDQKVAFANLLNSNLKWKWVHSSKYSDVDSESNARSGLRIGVKLDENDDPYTPGIVVSPTLSITPLGMPVPFREDDRIISFEGNIIFSDLDLIRAIHDFARYKGAASTYSAIVERYGELSLVEGTMFFANTWRTWNCDGAFIDGAIGSFSLGMDVPVWCSKQILFDNYWQGDSGLKRCIASTWNDRFWYRQFCSADQSAGEIAGMFTSVLGLLRAGVRRLTLKEASKRSMGGRALSSAGLNATEEMIWSLSGAVPGRTLGEKVQDAGLAGTQGFAAGIITGVANIKNRGANR